MYLKDRYGHLPIYIHENGAFLSSFMIFTLYIIWINYINIFSIIFLGFSTPANVTVDDLTRIDGLKAYIGGVLSSIRSFHHIIRKLKFPFLMINFTLFRNGSTVRGYFVWSFLDVFELLSGYKSRLGLYYVDFEDEKRPRKPKLSALWYRNFLKDTEGLKSI